jgi:pimeloyl-ACP methyl ester carboxylesterase
VYYAFFFALTKDLKMMLRILLTLMIVAVLGTAHAEEIVLEDNGLHLDGRLSVADGHQIQEGVVLLLHGTFAHNDMEIIQALEGLLNEKGYNTLAINLGLGVDNRHGQLDCGNTHRHRHTDALHELDLWVSWLKSQDVKRIVLMGHSRGGNQVVWYAMAHPDPVIQKVVAIAPMTWDRKAEAAEYQKRYGQSLDEVMARARELQERGNGEAIMRPVGFVYCQDAAVSADAFIDYYQDVPEKNTPSIVDKVGVPVMVFAGSEDDVVKSLVPQMKSKLKPGKVELVIIDGADHFFRDLYAEDLVDDATAFIGWQED